MFASNSKMFRDASTYAWFHLKPLIANLQKAIPSGGNEGPMAFSPAKIITALGISDDSRVVVYYGNDWGLNRTGSDVPFTKCRQAAMTAQEACNSLQEIMTANYNQWKDSMKS